MEESAILKSSCMRFSDVSPGPRRPVQQWSMQATRRRRWEGPVTRTTLTTKHQCRLLPRVVRGVSATNQRSHDVGRNDRSPDRIPGRGCRQTMKPRIGRGTAMRKHRKTLKSNTFWRYSPKCHLKAQKITLCNHFPNPVSKREPFPPTVLTIVSVEETPSPSVCQFSRKVQISFAQIGTSSNLPPWDTSTR